MIHMEMMHAMPNYPEVVVDLTFDKISMMPLELRAGVHPKFLMI